MNIAAQLTGADYTDFMLRLTDWIVKDYPNTESWQQILQRKDRSQRNVIALNDFTDGYSISMNAYRSSDNSVTKSTSLIFKITENLTFPLKTHELSQVSPYDYIVVKFNSAYSYGGIEFESGTIYELPALFVYAIMHQMKEEAHETRVKYTLHAAFLAIGVAEIMAAQTTIEMTIALTDMRVASADIIINEALAKNLNKTKDGRAFLNGWNKFAFCIPISGL